MKYYIFAAIMLAISCISVSLASDHHPHTVWLNEQQYYYRVGGALLGLGILGNMIAWLNSVPYEKLPAYLHNVKWIVGYEVPSVAGDPGIASFINKLCAESWQKYTFFTLAGIVPGIYLLYKANTTSKADSTFLEE